MNDISDIRFLLSSLVESNTSMHKEMDLSPIMLLGRLYLSSKSKTKYPDFSKHGMALNVSLNCTLWRILLEKTTNPHSAFFWSLLKSGREGVSSYPIFK
jgi:hypothetical protein